MDGARLGYATYYKPSLTTTAASYPLFTHTFNDIQDGVYIEATNTVYLENSAIREDGGDEYIPPLSNSHSGANFFYRETQIMHLVRLM